MEFGLSNKRMSSQKRIDGLEAEILELMETTELLVAKVEEIVPILNRNSSIIQTLVEERDGKASKRV